MVVTGTSSKTFAQPAPAIEVSAHEMWLMFGFICLPVVYRYPPSHNHGSVIFWVPPVLVTFQIPPCSTSMIMEERVFPGKSKDFVGIFLLLHL